MSRQESNLDRLFVGQLPTDVTEQEIQEHFGRYGAIKDVFLPRSGAGKAKRIAFVTFEEARSIYAALAVKNQVLRGEELNLAQALPKGQNSGPVTRSGEVNTRVFINNIPDGVSNEALSEYFSQWGEIKDVFYTPPRSFGYVTFAQEQDMFTCLAHTPLVINDQQLKAEIAKPRPPQGGGRGGRDDHQSGGHHQQQGFSGYEYGGFGAYGMGGAYGAGAGAGYGAASGGGGYGGGGGGYSAGGGGGGYGAPQRESRGSSRSSSSEPNTRLFVGNISSGTSEQVIRDHFSQFGTVQDVFKTKSGGSGKTGFMFVSFSNQKEMYGALAAESHDVNGDVLRVVEAEPKPGEGGSGRGAPAPSRGGGGDGGKSEHRLFVGRIPKGVTDDDIKAHFKQFGAVEDCYRPRSQQSSRDGHEFGFVVYGSQRDMARALSEHKHIVCQAELEVKRAEPRPPRGGGGSGGAGMPIVDVRDVQAQQAAMLYGAYSPYSAAAMYDPSSFGLAAPSSDLSGYGAGAYSATGGRSATKREGGRFQPY